MAAEKRDARAGKPPWGWDYALSFAAGAACAAGEDACGPVLEGDGARVGVLARLAGAGFVLSQLYVPSEGVVLVRFALPDAVMKEKAALLGMELRLKDEYGGGYLAFAPARAECFVNHDQQRERAAYFCPSDRVLIILNVLQSKEHWGCGLDIEKLLYERVLLQAFALHSPPERRALLRTAVWARMWDPTWVPPFFDLKEYVGARVGLYFAFVSFYARRLLVIAVLSIPVYIAFQLVRQKVVVAALRWVFAMGLVLWTTFFLEFWKRRNAMLILEWGLDDYKEDTADDTRPQFVGDLRFGFYCRGGFVSLTDLVEEDSPLPSSVDAERLQSAADDDMERGHAPAPAPVEVRDLPKNPYQDPVQARNLYLQSLGITAFFVLVIGSLTFLLLFFRNDIIDYFEGRGTKFANVIPGALNAVLITAFDPIWRVVSLALVRRENHRTNQRFENSLIYKRFAFQAISNYMSLFYIAFIKRYTTNNPCRIGKSGKPDCMMELEFQLMSLVITKATLQQVMEVGIPFITSRIKQWRARSRSNRHLENAREEPGGPQLGASSAHNRYVEESHLAPYNSTIEDYAELVIQFGYLVLFGLAFPLASLVNLINNLFEVRTDAFKVLALSQRVDSDDAADIGAWYNILEFINVLAVVTNVGMLVFTADTVTDILNLDRLPAESTGKKTLYLVVSFFVIEHFLILLKGFAAKIIKDVPARTHRTVARQKYDTARAFDMNWHNSFRGSSLLKVDEEQIKLCEKYANVFDQASDAGSSNEGED